MRHGAHERLGRRSGARVPGPSRRPAGATADSIHYLLASRDTARDEPGNAMSGVGAVERVSARPTCELQLSGEVTSRLSHKGLLDLDQRDASPVGCWWLARPSV